MMYQKMAIMAKPQQVRNILLYCFYMRWQDIVISVVQVCFVFAMWPSIKGKDKPALTTSLMNVVLVSIIAFCMLTLHLWFSTTTSLMVASTWAVLAIQKLQTSRQLASEIANDTDN
jgi:hypothetical protein